MEEPPSVALPSAFPPANGEPATAVSKPKQPSIRNGRSERIFQDVITVTIPLSVTADLGIAIYKSRQKRTAWIYQHYPSLKPVKPKETDKTDSKGAPSADGVDVLEDDEDDDGEEKNDESRPSHSPSKAHVPKREHYGSILDYLEAKYVQGVTVTEQDVQNASDDDEGQGSVYSQASFLDDTDLQRDVASQVLSHSTHTKLELEHHDADFFVNVGNLEVQPNEYLEQHYDPIDDLKAAAASKKKKKTKKTTTPKASKTNDNTSLKQTNEQTPAPKKRKTPKAATSAPATKKAKKSTPPKQQQQDAQHQDAQQKQDLLEEKFQALVQDIHKLTAEELPKRITKVKVSLTCPLNKKPGDEITFTNPHIPGQRLRVNIPKDTPAGGTFKVSVPVAPNPDESDHTDHNKIPRELQERIDEYARAYDEWCDAQGLVQADFSPHAHKRKKYDRLSKVFPTNLMTPVNQDYLKRLVRRARQNRYKRSKFAQKQKQQQEQEEQQHAEEPKEEEEESEEEREEPKPSTMQIPLPRTGRVFPEQTFQMSDFQ